MGESVEFLRDKAEALLQTLKHIWWFMDGPNWLFVLVSIPLFGYVVLKGDGSTTALVIAIFTAVYAFVVQNQMRGSTTISTPTVRKDYNESGGECDFGLRNFGPGPALYLRIFAEVVQEGSEEDEADLITDEVLLRVDEKPMHLREGEFVSLIDEDFPPLKPDNDHLKLKLYYTFTDGNGNGIPPNLSNHREIPFKEMAEKTSNPRSISLGVLRKQCAENGENS